MEYYWHLYMWHVTDQHPASQSVASVGYHIHSRDKLYIQKYIHLMTEVITSGRLCYVESIFTDGETPYLKEEWRFYHTLTGFCMFRMSLSQIKIKPSDLCPDPIRAKYPSPADLYLKTFERHISNTLKYKCSTYFLEDYQYAASTQLLGKEL